jgi:hypothetical protein
MFPFCLLTSNAFLSELIIALRSYPHAALKFGIASCGAHLTIPGVSLCQKSSHPIYFCTAISKEDLENNMISLLRNYKVDEILGNF